METDKTDVLSHYATKEDLQGVRIEVQAVLGEVRTLRSEMRAEMRALHAEMLALHAKAMEEIHKLRGEMNEMRIDIERAMHAQTWKMVGLVLSVNIATVTAVYYIASN